MANKWRESVSTDNSELVRMVIDDSIIANSVNIEILSDDEAKEPITATIENQRVVKLTGGEQSGIEVTIILNELIFDMFPQDFKILAVEEALHGIYRNKSDKVVRDTEDSFSSYLGFLQKVGTDKFVIYKESVRSAKRAVENGEIPDKRQTAIDFKNSMDDVIDNSDDITSISIKANDQEIKFEGNNG